MEDAKKLSSNMAEDENEDGEADESDNEAEITPGFNYMDNGHLEIVTAEAMAEALVEHKQIEDKQDTEYDVEEDCKGFMRDPCTEPHSMVNCR
jgi:hypothetical protein